MDHTAKTTTQLNWIWLKRLTLRQLERVRTEHPEWSHERLFTEMGLPHTALLEDLAAEAGFRPEDAPSLEQANQIVALFARGIWALEVLAEETGLSVECITGVLDRHKLGYGIGPFGQEAFGGKRFRQRSRNGNAVLRKVTLMGQMTYGNRTYTLGREYRGRIASVREDGERLLADFPDRPSITLYL